MSSHRSCVLPTVALAASLLTACSSSAVRQTPIGNGVNLATPQSVSPGSIIPAPMARTVILPPSVMVAATVRTIEAKIQGVKYVQIPGAAIAASGASDGSLWALSTQPSGPNKYIWHYSGGTWTNISGLASAVSIGANGTLYAINSSGGAYAYNNGTWTALGGGCSAITAASDGSFYVLSNGNSAGSDQAIWHYAAGWSQVAGAGVAIAASWDPNNYTQSNGTVQAHGLYVLNSIGNIYYENTSGNGTFVQLPGSASAVAPTTVGGVFVLGFPSSSIGNSIYYYNLNVPSWSTQPGSGVSISAGGDVLYVINMSGAIYSSPIIPTVQINEYPLPSSGSAGPLGIAAGPDGALWFTTLSPNNGQSRNLTENIGRVTTSGTGAITEYTPPTMESLPYGITGGPDGALWFAENNGYGSIGRVTTSGAFTEYPTPTKYSGPYGITAGSDGALWFTEEFTGYIGRITTSGTITEYPTPTANSFPLGITAGPDGALWFTESGGNKIGRVTTSEAFIEFPIPTLGSGPSAITAGPDGALWFTELQGNKIGRVTTSGTFTEYPIPTASSEPFGITAGPDGALWFTEGNSSAITNKIGRVTTSGVFSEYPIATIGSAPRGIVTGPDGALWFTENGGDKIGQVILY